MGEMTLPMTYMDLKMGGKHPPNPPNQPGDRKCRHSLDLPSICLDGLGHGLGHNPPALEGGVNVDLVCVTAPIPLGLNEVRRDPCLQGKGCPPPSKTMA